MEKNSNFKLLRNVCKTYDRFIKDREIENHKNVLVVRYEDIAKEPKSMSSKMFDFTGIDKYVPKKKRFQTENEAKPTAAFSWFLNRQPSSLLPFWAIQKIQDSCGRVFKTFGYKNISEAQYTNLMKYAETLHRNKKKLKKFYEQKLPDTLLAKYGCVSCRW